ncbi:hypothetical protein MMC26_007252 [Xylographa opegraphella]|nr:hypothetical protein [Xylographa opegraphella]
MAAPTFFEALKKSFTDVPIDTSKDNAITTTDFLEATESLCGLFDIMGSVAFTPVKNDMLGNVKKLRDRQLASPAESSILQSLVVNELKTKKHTAAEGLLWLTRQRIAMADSSSPNQGSPLDETVPRTMYQQEVEYLTVPFSGLDFTAQGLRHNLSNPSEELSVSFRHAYGNTLKPHHSFMIKPIFAAAMSATPYRKDFYAKLDNDPVQGKREMEKWLSALEERVTILKDFLGTKVAKW